MTFIKLPPRNWGMHLLSNESASRSKAYRHWYENYCCCCCCCSGCCCVVVGVSGCAWKEYPIPSGRDGACCCCACCCCPPSPRNSSGFNRIEGSILAAAKCTTCEGEDSSIHGSNYICLLLLLTNLPPMSTRHWSATLKPEETSSLTREILSDAGAFEAEMSQSVELES